MADAGAEPQSQPEQGAAAQDEIADVLVYLIETADALGIDPLAAVRQKLVKNAKISRARRRPMSENSHFSHHVFFCTNQRPNGESLLPGPRCQ